jgi:hypothetical protein
MYFQQMNNKVLAIGDAGNALDSTLYNFWGLGLTNTGILRYQTPSSCTHAFYVNDNASTEVVGITTNKMYINGRLDINTGTAGNYNMSISNNGLTALTTGLNNIIIGNNCGSALTTGSGNVAIGKDCFTIATTSTGCTAIGRISMANANGNVADTGCGVNTLGYSTVGYNSAFGSSALSSVSTGTQNIAVGVDAGYTAGPASQNTYLGCFSDIDSNTSTWSNSVALGYQALISSSNTIQLGNNSVSRVNTGGSITCGGYSNYISPVFQGLTIGWNRSGSSGRSTFANAQGGGNGGFEWINYNNSLVLTSPTPLMTLDNAGVLTINGGILLPTSGGTQTNLNYYEEYTHNTNFSGPVTVGLYGLHLVRVGKMITIYMANSPLLSTVTAGQLTWNMNTTLPSRFYPVTAVNTVVVGRNNNVLTLMNVVIDSSGNMIISVALTSSVFAGTIGFNTFSMSWTV